MKIYMSQPSLQSAMNHARFARCAALRDKIINLRYVNNLNFGRVPKNGKL